MTIIEDTGTAPPGLLRRAGRILAWLLGASLVLVGLTSLVTVEAGPIIMGAGLVLAGVLILPPVAARMRRYAAILRPVWAPPALALVLGFLLLMVGAVIGVAPKPPPPPPPPPAKAVAPPPPPDPAEIARRYKADLAGYIMELNSKIIPEVEGMTKADPYKLSDIDAELAVFDRAAQALERGQAFADDPLARDAALRLQSVLISKQVAIFPVLRHRYAAILRGKYWFWWGLDFEVEGPGNRILRASGRKFHSNAQIWWFHTKLASRSEKLRFLQMIFNRGRSRLYSAETYNLGDPSDAAVGYWTKYPQVLRKVPLLKPPAAARPPAKRKPKRPLRSPAARSKTHSR